MELQRFSITFNQQEQQQQQDHVLIVDQKIINFATQCNYYQHWRQSLINIFTDTQLDGLGTSITKILDDVSNLNLPVEVYNYARSLDHDPVKEPLKLWLTIELQKAASYSGPPLIPQPKFPFFFAENKEILETDLFYEIWGFIKSVIWNSCISANGSEDVSGVNADAIDKDRPIGAIEPTSKRKIGHKIDMGVMKKNAHSKRVQVPMVVMDSLGGRSSFLEYLTCSDDFIKSIIPLFKMALTGLTIILQSRDALVTVSPEIQSQRASNR
ncbi:hypothetical protein BDA99DRAFT_535798 [Phascolomyces articulosus]|uniref:Uncharacterized protein n=1 Tax=Phascolomyces articulosus TaxID=60185 RepID=A0AAD5KE72_9FUNG|nr:hypothetical protein BDA99DRAFT_535798 [Phascolomyces articulosus]